MDHLHYNYCFASPALMCRRLTWRVCFVNPAQDWCRIWESVLFLSFYVLLLLASFIEIPDIDHFILDQLQEHMGSPPQSTTISAVLSYSKPELCPSIGSINWAMPLLRALQPQIFCHFRNAVLDLALWQLMRIGCTISWNFASLPKHSYYLKFYRNL